MFLHGRARNQIFFAKLGFDSAGGEVLLCTIPLDAARGAGDTGLGVKGKGIVNGQSKVAVAAGRDKSLLVVGHGNHDNVVTRHIGRLSPEEAWYLRGHFGKNV